MDVSAVLVIFGFALQVIGLLYTLIGIHREWKSEFPHEPMTGKQRRAVRAWWHQLMRRPTPPDPAMVVFSGEWSAVSAHVPAPDGGGYEAGMSLDDRVEDLRLRLHAVENANGAFAAKLSNLTRALASEEKSRTFNDQQVRAQARTERREEKQSALPQAAFGLLIALIGTITQALPESLAL